MGSVRVASGSQHDASGTLDRRESVPTCRSFAAEAELHPELFPSETADSGLDALFTSFDQRVAEDEEIVADLTRKCPWHKNGSAAPRAVRLGDIPEHWPSGAGLVVKTTETE